MMQLYDTYRMNKKVASLVRQLPWAHSLIILSHCNTSSCHRVFSP